MLSIWASFDHVFEVFQGFFSFSSYSERYAGVEVGTAGLCRVILKPNACKFEGFPMYGTKWPNELEPTSNFAQKQGCLVFPRISIFCF